MNKRIDIIYNTNEQEWELERIAKKNGFTLTDNCYWVQIMRNQDGDSIVLTREDSAMAHDPVGRLIAILEEWENDPGLQQEYPRFSWYVAACQTYQGGTLEEIRE